MKVKSYLVALIMLTCVFAVTVSMDESDADSAPTSAPTIKFWAYENNGWVGYSGTGYYAGQAIANSNLTFTWGSDTYYGTTLSGVDFTYQYVSYGTTYTSINPFYGKIATVNGSSDFTIYRYSGNAWAPISDDGVSVMGFYKAFNDCQLSAANIAFVPSGFETLPSSDLASIYNVIPADGSTPDSAYAVTFNVNITTEAGTIQTYAYVGYGSDCATAFKDAMVRNNISYAINLNMVSNGSINNNYYGEVTQILDKAKSTTYVASYESNANKTTVVANYEYWSLYLANNTSSSFMLGFMSPLTSVPSVSGYPSLTQVNLTFQFEEFEYSWTETGDTTGNYS